MLNRESPWKHSVSKGFQFSARKKDISSGSFCFPLKAFQYQPYSLRLQPIRPVPVSAFGNNDPFCDQFCKVMNVSSKNEPHKESVLKSVFR
jgi:hypothetical protein